MASTFRLNDTLNYVLPYVNYYPLTEQNGTQPFVGMCNAVAQVMLAPPFRHNFNRSTVDFVTTSGTQNYIHANSWVSATAYTVGQIILDGNNNGQKVLVAGTSGNSTPSWSTGLFTTTADSSVTWQNIGAIVNIQSVTDFSYIEKAQIQDINNNNQWKELQVSLDISRDTATACPKYVSAQLDDNSGDLMLRLIPTPGAAYPVSVEYQKLQVPFTTLNSLWSPIPDRLFDIYGMGVLALAYLKKNDTRFAWASQQFVARMLSYADGLSQTQINQFLIRWNATTGDGSWSQQSQQGTMARGT